MAVQVAGSTHKHAKWKQPVRKGACRVIPVIGSAQNGQIRGDRGSSVAGCLELEGGGRWRLTTGGYQVSPCRDENARKLTR